jgi:hypothetical protein
MIELISIIASLAICILVPIEVRRIRGGWMRKSFVGGRAKFIASYRRQLTLLTWMGVVFGVLGIGLALIETKPGETTVKSIGAAIWFVVAGICFYFRPTLPDAPETDGAQEPAARK